jgi:hypothetical protein
MPLYNIKNVNFNNIPLIDGSHLRVMWTHVIRHANEFHMKNTVSPIIFAGAKVVDILAQSTNFSYINISDGPMSYMGQFMGWHVYLELELDSNEYIMGVDDSEVKRYLRNHKLKQLIKKLNATT